ncbi:solute carrier family 25 member 45-like [Ylistrum balloti]|uniref:solute carrier family 25 member 45-like n=1 Tax=Ylistrum balloti TaxID=509963 RepID=UPI002905D1A4|nr:solute carrier family 25 member 45-like [Ylistrum balloti]
MTERVMDHYVAGALGGTAGYFVGYPLDTIKVQLQTQSGDKRGLLTALSNTWGKGVAGGFFRGMSWPLLTTGCTTSVFYGVYGNTLTFLEPEKAKQKSAYGKIVLAGSVAGMTQAIPIIPIEYVKVVLQSQISLENKSNTAHVNANIRHFRGPTDCARNIVRTNGMVGLLKGATVTLPRDVIFFANYGLIYECISEFIKQKKWTDSQGFLADFIGGGFSGSLSWILAIPFDVIKSRYQADFHGKYASPVDCAIQSYRTEGLGVFYTGCFVTCVRAFPVCAVSFMVYAQVTQWLRSNE